MDFQKRVPHLLGCKVEFLCKEGLYEGIILYVSPQQHRLVVDVNHVYALPERKYMSRLTFTADEILDYTVISPKKEVTETYYSPILESLRGRTNSVNTVTYLHDLDSEDETESDQCPVYAEDFAEEEFVLKLPENIKHLPNESIIISDVDSSFQSAIECISKENTIGVSFEGPKISRVGRLSWICISTCARIFLFDIEAVGKRAFDHGLKSIFENDKIEKVIHDCRQPADCLRHIYNTELVNVFDTQVADFFINKQRLDEMKTLNFVSSLDTCLVHHLKVPQEFLIHRKTLSYDHEVRFFTMRPISSDFRNLLIKNAAYLLLLKDKLFSLMLDPYRRAVDIYLKVLANASAAELLLDLSVPDKVPPFLFMNNLKTVAYKESYSLSKMPKVSFTLPCEVQNPLNSLKIEKKVDQLDKRPLSNVKSRVQRVNSNGNKQGDDSEKDKPLVENCNTRIARMQKTEKPTSYLVSDVIAKNDELSTNQEEEHVISMQVPYNHRYVDKVYHRLVNSHINNQNFQNTIDIKPSEENISTFVVKKSRPKYSSIFAKVLEDSDSDKTEAKHLQPRVLQKSIYSLPSSEAFIKPPSSVITDSSDVWAKLRKAFNDPDQPVTEVKKKVRLLPSGMD